MSASVTAMTRSPSSAVRRSSASTVSTAVCSGESRQIAAVSDSSASGASVTSTGSRPRSGSSWCRISGRTSGLDRRRRARRSGPGAHGVEPPRAAAHRCDHRRSKLRSPRVTAVDVHRRHGRPVRPAGWSSPWIRPSVPPSRSPAAAPAAGDDLGGDADRGLLRACGRRGRGRSGWRAGRAPRRSSPASRSRASRSSWVRREPIAPT